MKNALITGASSGIGAALARELARRGWSLALLARRIELLDAVAHELRASGTKVVTVACDVTDLESVRSAVREAEAALGGALDLAIANAGVSIPGQAAAFNVAEAEQVIRVNVLGMFYLFDATIPKMVERGSGRFVGIASVAGLRGLPTAAAYSASKAAMQNFLEASRVELAWKGVGVTTVNPGFVITPMTAKNRFPMPFLMSVEKAVKIIADGIDRGKRVIEFPLRMSLLMRGARLVPSALWDRAIVTFGRKKTR